MPVQLVAVSNPDLIDLQDEIRAGEIIKADNQYFWKQRVVYAGIDLNAVSRINVTTTTFTVDFYLWMRYSGNDDAATIAFTNASDVSFDSIHPQSSQIVNDTTLPLVNQTGSGQRLQYRRYHITGDFKASYNFHDYPFDQQQLTIGFQNTRLTSEHLVYVIDAPGLRLNPDNQYAAQIRRLSNYSVPGPVETEPCSMPATHLAVARHWGTGDGLTCEHKRITLDFR